MATSANKMSELIIEAVVAGPRSKHVAFCRRQNGELVRQVEKAQCNVAGVVGFGVYVCVGVEVARGWSGTKTRSTVFLFLSENIRIHCDITLEDEFLMIK